MREDFPAVQAAVEKLPATALLEEDYAYLAARFALDAREPEKALQILRAFPNDYISSGRMRGPKTIMTGWAHEMAGRMEAAKADWRAARKQIDDRLAQQPNEITSLLAKALVHACLGEKAEAEQVLRLALELVGAGPDSMNDVIASLHVRLGDHEPVLRWLTKQFKEREPGWERVHAHVRFDFMFDPLRNDPRFEALLRETLPPGAKPFEEAK